MLAWQTLRLHNKPICLLNTLGFYDSMLRFLDHCQSEGVLRAGTREMLHVADTVGQALALLESKS